MNTKFTILVAAGLLFAGITQAQGTVAADKGDFNNPRHAVVVREHKAKMHQPKHQVRHKKHVKHHHKMHRHHKRNHGHR